MLWSSQLFSFSSFCANRRTTLPCLLGSWAWPHDLLWPMRYEQETEEPVSNSPLPLSLLGNQ